MCALVCAKKLDEEEKEERQLTIILLENNDVTLTDNIFNWRAQIQRERERKRESGQKGNEVKGGVGIYKCGQWFRALRLV